VKPAPSLHRSEKGTADVPYSAPKHKDSGTRIPSQSSVRKHLRILNFLGVQAVEAGATVIFGEAGEDVAASSSSSSRTPGVGYYVSPTILGGVSDGDEAWDSEIFGPVREGGRWRHLYIRAAGARWDKIEMY